MAQTLTAKTVEFASGQTGSMPFNVEGSNSYNYPLVQTVPGELGGLSVYTFIGAASNNAQTIKSTPGQVYHVSVFSVTDTAPVYLKFYDKASTPAPATDTVKMPMPIPAAPLASNPCGYVTNYPFPVGISFATGISVAVVTGIGNTDNTSLGNANRQIVTVYYK